MNKKYICLVLLMITCLMQGMEEASTTQTKISVGKELKTCKKNAGVSCEDLVLKKQPTILSLTQRTYLKKANNTPSTPRQLQETESEPVTAVDIVHAQDFLYVLGEDKGQRKHIFSKKIYNIQKPTNGNFQKLQKQLVNSLSYKDPYFFQFQMNKLEAYKQIATSATYPIDHNTPILSFGTLDKNIFSGSLWPSIKKSTIEKEKYKPKTESFIDNAYLLACQDNGMIIAKIDEKDNTQFWIWRRLFKKENDVRVTLYALFFEPNSIQNINKKMIEEALNEAYEQKKLNYNNNTYTKGNITAITLAKNVILTAAEQKDPFRKFPKAAIGKDYAVVLHTQQSEFSLKEKKVEYPMASITYKEANGDWKAISYIFEKQDFSDKKSEWITKQKQIVNNHIRLPDLYEIKDVYCTKIDNTPYVLLVTQTDKKGFCADGVYAIPLTGQKKNDLLQPFWHVDIQITAYTNTTRNTNNKTWRSLEKIVASTFDYKKKNLFLITESLNKNKQNVNKKQELITININNLKK